MQEAQASALCILEVHKCGQAYIVLWAQSLTELYLRIHKSSKKCTLLWTLLHTCIKMRFSPPVHAEFPRWKWQMSEMRGDFVRLYRLMHPFFPCFLHARAIIPCHLTPGLGQSFGAQWQPWPSYRGRQLKASRATEGQRQMIFLSGRLSEVMHFEELYPLQL